MDDHATPDKLDLTVYCARAGDHNVLGMSGAVSIGRALSKRLGMPVHTIGHPEHILNAGWETELAAAMPTLSELAEHLDKVLAQGKVPVLALSRCAASLATLPVVMRHRPDTCVVWLDAHPDLNVPETTASGYLGGMALAGPSGLWDSGLGNGLPLANIVLVGARNLDPPEQALVDAEKVHLVPPGSNYLAELRDAIDGRPVYVHLDCDVLEPGILPTDYRVPGGFTLAELHAICEVLSKNALTGLEIAEFENAWSLDGDPVSPKPLLDALEPLVSRLGSAA